MLTLALVSKGGVFTRNTVQSISSSSPAEYATGLGRSFGSRKPGFPGKKTIDPKHIFRSPCSR